MEEMKIDRVKNYIHLFSGGLDSTYTLLKLALDIDKGKRERHQIQPVFIDFGQFAASAEFNSVTRIFNFIRTQLKNQDHLIDPVHISLRSDLFTWCKNVAFTGKEVGDQTCEIENRNMVLISIIASYLIACAQNQGIGTTSFEIHSGFRDGEMPDCSRAFFDKLEILLSNYKRTYHIRLELIDNISRDRVCRRIKKLLKGDEKRLKQLLRLTSSCYAPQNGKPCGSCWKCNRIREEKKLSKS